MTDSVLITIPGEPMGKERPRMNGSGRVFTPKKTKQAESAIALAVIAAMVGLKPFDGPVSARVTAYFSVPPSWPQWKRNAALDGRLRHTSTPDADNIGKLIFDGLNKSNKVWADDAYLNNFSVTKEYAVQPRTEVLLFSSAGQAASKVTRKDQLVTV